MILNIGLNIFKFKIYYSQSLKKFWAVFKLKKKIFN